MPSKSKNLSSLFRSAIIASKPSQNPQDAALKNYVSAIDPFSPSTSLSKAIDKRSIKSANSKKLPQKLNSDVQFPALILEEPSGSGDSMKHLTKAISSILCGSSVRSPNAQENGDENSLKQLLDIPWFSNMSNYSISLRRREISRERKQKWIFKNSQNYRFSQLVRNCAQKLGTDVTLEVFGKLGRETGVKEYNALIDICLEKAKTSKDLEVVLEQIAKVYQLFKLMKEHGFQLEDETYGPVLTYLIDMDMMEEFNFFCEAVKDGNPGSNSRLGYYEMLFYVKINDVEKIQELCEHAIAHDGVDKYSLQENYLLALCECEQKEELLQMLEIVDITKLSSTVLAANIFKCLGRLLLHSIAEKLLVALKTSGNGAENIPYLIYNHVVSIPNLAIEDMVSKFKSMHFDLDIKPSSVSYEKLICYCCGSLKVHMALDIANEMCDADFTPSTDVLHSILHAMDEGCEFNLVHQVYSLICRHNLKPDSEVFRRMISLCIKMKDFNGAYDMLKESEKMNFTPTASMYNAIMAGYFREKNTSDGLMVLKQMELADVKPDSKTFSYLISYCECEEDIIKYYEELKSSGVQATKHIFMALINAYAAHGQFEKAKQVISDEEIPVKNLNEIRSVLVSALASNAQLADALKIYDEMKQAGCNLEPKAVISLIEHYPFDGPVNRIFQLLGELHHDLDDWIDCCRRILLFSVKHNDLSSTVDLLKQLSYRCCNDEVMMGVAFDEIFSLIAESEPSYLETGLQLLQFIKNDLGLSPPRRCLDFLLGACANAKDAESSLLIWKEYEKAGLPHNTISYLRMYQALLASGDQTSAKVLLEKIPKDDAHVCYVIKECESVYVASSSVNKKKGRHKKKMLKMSRNGREV
ncbi:pentatricopeptide repeat-containing protein At4g04790, mitochondrial-like isoform X2 [Cucurbita pepo subsp. pepo]|uniref:pentatricopeptide repeat-containing protein At4g04790, mitochondrial-like isoform X2 n=1 Tax=Cucurbita pepo subsp. pepo TaxID=3664 RepID=UPI000C9D5F9B|nr:pentatricopeptide repeat-containing protein At4g04790, mitochondrial-like isoform X2 [Cucurbita pepo subsp. pepo]